MCHSVFTVYREIPDVVQTRHSRLDTQSHVSVLGLAMTGLIFTRRQKGTQPGWPNWPKKMEYSIPCKVMLGGGAGRREVKSGSGVRRASDSESCSVHFAVCFVYFLLSVLLLLLFASFAVLLNCPYPDPRVLSIFFHSSPHPSGGSGDRATAWSFVASWGQTSTVRKSCHWPFF